MISRYGNYDILEQDYLEELIRQTLPNCKINNIVPHNGLVGISLVNPCPILDAIVYFGHVGNLGASSSPSVQTLLADDVEFPFEKFAYASPVLFKGFNYVSSGSFFSGWKIMLENPPVNPVTVTPPISVAVEYPDLFVFPDMKNPSGATVNFGFLAGAVHEPLLLRFISGADSSSFDIELPSGQTSLHGLLPINITSGVQLRIFRQSDLNVIVFQKAYNYLSLPFVLVSSSVVSPNYSFTFGSNGFYTGYTIPTNFVALTVSTGSTLTPINGGTYPTKTRIISAFGGATNVNVAYNVAKTYTLQGGTVVTRNLTTLVGYNNYTLPT
ncbi:MAG: hypothetical protein QM763_03110 [Agriterribacter sp.]